MGIPSSAGVWPGAASHDAASVSLAGEFRHDINGLRALAVAAVLLYHFDVPGFAGGFIGVDIFFVISGYLMSRIVFEAHARHRFSIAAFYWDRVKRIVPALVALCLVLLALGYVLLLPSEYRLLAKHAGGSVAFVSNLVYQGEHNYFGVASREKWLLHTWSLSVEWQFYLLFPLFTAALFKWVAPRRWLAIFAAFTLVSFACCLVIARFDQTAAFFQIASRAWEMAAGGLVMLASRGPSSTQRPSAQVSLGAGLALIVASLVLIDGNTPWPGKFTVLPVLGTMLVIHAGARDAAWARLAPVQSLGRWSYSVYLWHWPLLVALGYLFAREEAAPRAAGIALAVVLGAASFRWIETPARRALGSLGPPRGMLVLLPAWAVALGAAAVVVKTDGFESRAIPEAARLAEREKANKSRQAKGDCSQPYDGLVHPCLYGTGPLGAIVFGDSHAGAIASAVAEAYAPSGRSIALWGFASCPTVSGIVDKQPSYEACTLFVRNALDRLAHEPPDMPVFVINRWPFYIEGARVHEPGHGISYYEFEAGESPAQFRERFADRLVDTLCPIARDRKVFVLQSVPEMPFDVPLFMARAAMWSKAAHDVGIAEAEHARRNARVTPMLERLRDRCAITLLDPAPLLCRDGRCAGSIAGRPLYFDDDHMSETGNKLLAPLFRNAVRN